MRIAVFVLGLGLVAAPASAQSRFYAGAVAAVDAGTRGGMTVGRFPAAGALVGLRFNPAWSVEFHFDRGFGDGTPHGRLGHFGVDTLHDHAGTGNAVLMVWRSRPRGRVAGAVSFGISERRFRTEQTIGVDRPVNLPPDDILLQNKTGTTSGAGPTVGLLLPIALGRGWSMAPELRAAAGMTSDGIYMDGIYTQFYSGVRMMWGF